MKRLLIAVGLMLLVVSGAQAGVGKAAYKTGRYVATLSPVKAVKVAAQNVSYPVRHPKKVAHGVKKVAY